MKYIIQTIEFAHVTFFMEFSDPKGGFRLSSRIEDAKIYENMSRQEVEEIAETLAFTSGFKTQVKEL